MMSDVLTRVLQNTKIKLHTLIMFHDMYVYFKDKILYIFKYEEDLNITK